MVMFLMLLMLVVIMVIMTKKDSKTAPYSPAGKTASDYLEYKECGWPISGYATLKKRDPAIRKIVDIMEDREVSASYTPDKYIYTGATVGGVTTGGITKIDGGYTINSGRKTGKYYLWHNYNRLGYNTNKFNREEWFGGEVYCIRLNNSDFEDAKKDPILKQHLITESMLADGKRLNLEAVKNPQTLIVGRTDKTFCEYVISWMCKSN